MRKIFCGVSGELSAWVEIPCEPAYSQCDLKEIAPEQSSMEKVLVSIQLFLFGICFILACRHAAQILELRKNPRGNLRF